MIFPAPQDRDGVMPVRDVIAWLNSVQNGEWNWARNGRCKYVTLRIDTRSGAYAFLDRDEKEITPDELRHQLGKVTSNDAS